MNHICNQFLAYRRKVPLCHFGYGQSIVVSRDHQVLSIVLIKLEIVCSNCTNQVTSAQIYINSCFE